MTPVGYAAAANRNVDGRGCLAYGCHLARFGHSRDLRGVVSLVRSAGYSAGTWKLQHCDAPVACRQEQSR